tara:strand:- start:145 stop:252 length:108 start_codon:yes stop_codon:yes gene_type:complete
MKKEQMMMLALAFLLGYFARDILGKRMILEGDNCT